MQADNWENAQNVMKEILDIYPKVKGMQILDDEGKPMFPSTKGQWLQDTPAQRAKILSTMVNWKPYSNSSPVEGIGAAVQGWWAADKKISVYVIGDDFTGRFDRGGARRRCVNTTPSTARDATASAFTPSACPTARVRRRLSIRVFLL